MAIRKTNNTSRDYRFILLSRITIRSFYAFLSPIDIHVCSCSFCLTIRCHDEEYHDVAILIRQGFGLAPPNTPGQSYRSEEAEACNFEKRARVGIGPIRQITIDKATAWLGSSAGNVQCMGSNLHRNDYCNRDIEQIIHSEWFTDHCFECTIDGLVMYACTPELGTKSSFNKDESIAHDRVRRQNKFHCNHRRRLGGG